MGHVIGFHVIGCTYGFWLPNEERGSGSDFVRSPALEKFGPPTRVGHRRSVARNPYDRAIRELAIASLRYPPVVFTAEQMASACRGVADEIERFAAAPMYAFALLANHFHFVCGPCRYDIRRFEGRVKGAATKQLLADGRHPLQRFRDRAGNVPSPWSVKPWVVYLFTPEDVVRSIEYVEENLRRARVAPQGHGFVVEYEGRTRGAALRR